MRTCVAKLWWNMDLLTLSDWAWLFLSKRYHQSAILDNHPIYFHYFGWWVILWRISFLQGILKTPIEIFLSRSSTYLVFFAQKPNRDRYIACIDLLNNRLSCFLEKSDFSSFDGKTRPRMEMEGQAIISMKLGYFNNRI